MWPYEAHTKFAIERHLCYIEMAKECGREFTNFPLKLARVWSRRDQSDKSIEWSESAFRQRMRFHWNALFARIVDGFAKI